MAGVGVAGEERGGLAPVAAGGALDPHGPDAARIADLWWLMLALGGLVFVVVSVLLVAALARRQASGGDAEGTARFSPWFVVAGVAVPASILAVVFAATLAAMRPLAEGPSGDALEVEIVGHRWWYEVRYPDAGVTVRDELRIPVGRPVALSLTSADVIHSFWVPELGGKRDLLPDGHTTLVLEASIPGTFQSRCAEFCGLHHATMQMTVVAEPVDRFEAWIATR